MNFFLGAGQVFVDLERSAVAVIRATGKEASKTVGHKWVTGMYYYELP